jgi:hypothetical protein
LLKFGQPTGNAHRINVNIRKAFILRLKPDQTVKTPFNLCHMRPIFRLITLATLFLTLGFTSGFAQDCGKVIKENKKVNGIQSASTSQLSIVIRSGYIYFLELFTDETGIYARLTSQGGIEFNRDDQVVFVDAGGQERAFKFIGNDERVPGSSVPTHKNKLGLDTESLKWIGESNIVGINFINFVDRQKYKFTVNADRQLELKNLVNCFLSILEKDVSESASSAVPTKPESAPSGGTSTGKPGAPAKPGAFPSGPATDSEVTALKSELEKTKERLRAEIKAEKDRAEATKAQIQQEVLAAREAANARKLEFNNEVLEARKNSMAEIEKAKAEAQNFIAQSKAKADSMVTENQLKCGRGPQTGR